MRWVTREKVHVDRIACPWFIRGLIEPQAGIPFESTDRLLTLAERLGAIPWDVANIQFGHQGQKCSVRAIVIKHALNRDAALALLAQIVNAADTGNTLWNHSESAELKAAAGDFPHPGFRGHHERNASEWIVEGALDGYCRQQTKQDLTTDFLWQ